MRSLVCSLLVSEHVFSTVICHFNLKIHQAYLRFKLYIPKAHLISFFITWKSARYSPHFFLWTSKQQSCLFSSFESHECAFFYWFKISKYARKYLVCCLLFSKYVIWLLILLAAPILLHFHREKHFSYIRFIILTTFELFQFLFWSF